MLHSPVLLEESVKFLIQKILMAHILTALLEEAVIQT